MRGDRALRASRPTSTIARDRRNLAVRGFARLHAARRLQVPHPLRHPAVRRPRHERGRLRRRADGRRPPLRARRRPARRTPPSSRATPTTSPPRCSAGSWSAPTARSTRFDPPAGLEAVLVVPHEPVRTAKARAALPARCRWPTRSFNVAHGALLMLGLARGRLGPRRPRARRPPAPALPRAPVPAVGGAGRARARARRARRDDLRRRPDRARLDATTSRPARVVEALRGEAEGWAEVIRAPFEPQGADVRALT